MNEQDIFDIMSGLPEKHIAEAAEWKYRQQSAASGNEIDTLFTHAAEQKATRPKTAETNGVTRVTVTQKAQNAPAADTVQPRIVRHSALGLTAVAAALVLAIGGIVLKLHSDRNEFTDPGTAASTEYTVTSDPAVSDSAVQTDSTVTGTEEQSTESTVTTTVTFAKDAAPVPHHEDDTVAPGELNFLGGHGKLYPVTSGSPYGIECIADEDNWYINGTRRISKTARDENGKPVEELLCQVAGCSHTTEENCLVAQYSSRLIAGQDAVYYYDTSEPSFIKGCIGQFKRILSDGTTENVIPSPNKKLSESRISQVYYNTVMPLGDTGIYYVRANFSTEDHFRTARLLADSRNGNIIELSDELQAMTPAQYDEQTGHLFLFEQYENQRSLNNSIDEQGIISADSEHRFNPGICEIDIYTGEEISRYKVRADYSWLIRDHALYTLSAPQEAAVNSTVDLFRTDLATGENTLLRNDCHFNSIMSCGDYIYAARHSAVGSDAIVRMRPDGSEETVIMETAGVIHMLLPAVNDELLFILTDTGIPFAVLPDGSTCQITY